MVDLDYSEAIEGPAVIRQLDLPIFANYRHAEIEVDPFDLKELASTVQLERFYPESIWLGHGLLFGGPW